MDRVILINFSRRQLRWGYVALSIGELMTSSLLVQSSMKRSGTKFSRLGHYWPFPSTNSLGDR
jgi:hypothetical protein